MINPRRGRALTTTIPLYTLSGGVGRQAPSKRLPSESQEISNALVTLERSIEKRPGVELIPYRGEPTDNEYNDNAIPLPDGGNYEYFWHSLSDTLRYLFVVDRSATEETDRLYYVFYYNQADNAFEDHTPASVTVDATVREYITYGGTEELKFAARAQNLVFLNTEVYAGYTSKPLVATQQMFDDNVTVDGQPVVVDTTYWCTLGLDGQFATTGTAPGLDYTEDPIGGEVEYLTATAVDPLGLAPFWDEYSTYLAGTQVLYIDNGKIYAANTDITTPGSLPTGADWDEITERVGERIPVRDAQYPDPATPQLGQAVSTFADLRLPPLDADVETGNNNAEEMLAALYGLDLNPLGPPFLNSAEGKVYYVETGYQGQNPGYYLMKSTEVPYTFKVRTPEAYSVLDSKRLPMELEFTGFDQVSKKSTWEWSELEWEVRTSGDDETNPGPSSFKEGKQTQLKTIAFFRNRLWFSGEDNVFSSQDGDLTNLWIADPGTIIDTDPIDVLASSNKYTPITSMVPFNDYLFINTNADTQYELMGWENRITPFTAELQPMTFYSTAPLVDPVTLGNNLFFFDRERLYLYMGRGGSLSTAVELSSHCPKYLPENYGPVTTAPAQDTIIAVDADEPGTLYLHTTRYRGNEIAQNAFYSFTIDGADVKTLQSWDNDLYMVAKRDTKFFIERVSLRYADPEIPRLDRQAYIETSFDAALPLNNIDPKFDLAGINMTYDANTLETTFRVPFYDPDCTVVLFGEGFGDLQGEAKEAVSITDGGTYSDYVVKGDYSQYAGGFFYVGKKYTMVVELSPMFVRGQDNNPREGVLSLASMSTRHFETGNYDVYVTRRGRPSSNVLLDYSTREDGDITNYITSFTAARSDTFAESTLTLPAIEYQGELMSKILGFADKTSIYIMSDYFTPVNITNIELKGKFKDVYSSII
jgi:hypothetical protein